MSLTAFLHGYPPGWSMGGEMSTHRTLRHVPGSSVFTTTDEPYTLDGVSVRSLSGTTLQDIMADAESIDARVLYAHSSMSADTVRAARRLKRPSILAVHAPPRFGGDLRKAWMASTVRLYNTNVARRDWRDAKGWLLHPPVGGPSDLPNGPRDALTLTSSLLNKGVTQTLALAARWPERRFIIVRSPAHATHGSADFEESAAALPNVEVWDRVHPDEMGRLWAETRVLLVPSRYETYGMSAVEAAWHGIPSVHVDTPHVQEGIGPAARLLKSQSVEELEHGVIEVERDFQLWSDRAFERAAELAARELRELAAFAAKVAALATR